MRLRALSNLELSKELKGEIAHTTVARWLVGSRPRGRTARLLAEYFGVPVKALLDDTQPLPVPGAEAYQQMGLTVDNAGEPYIGSKASVDLAYFRAVEKSLLDQASELDDKARGLKGQALGLRDLAKTLSVQIKMLQKP